LFADSYNYCLPKLYFNANWNTSTTAPLGQQQWFLNNVTTMCPLLGRYNMSQCTSKTTAQITAWYIAFWNANPTTGPTTITTATVLDI
jgi:hypothetical protein